MLLVAFGYKLCGIDDKLDDFDEEDEVWKEVFAAKCRKMPQVVAWIGEVLRIAEELATKPDDDDGFA